MSLSTDRLSLLLGIVIKPHGFLAYSSRLPEKALESREDFA